MKRSVVRVSIWAIDSSSSCKKAGNGQPRLTLRHLQSSLLCPRFSHHLTTSPPRHHLPHSTLLSTLSILQCSPAPLLSPTSTTCRKNIVVADSLSTLSTKFNAISADNLIHKTRGFDRRCKAIFASNVSIPLFFLEATIYSLSLHLVSDNFSSTALTRHRIRFYIGTSPPGFMHLVNDALLQTSLSHTV